MRKGTLIDLDRATIEVVDCARRSSRGGRSLLPAAIGRLNVASASCACRFATVGLH